MKIFNVRTIILLTAIVLWSPTVQAFSNCMSINSAIHEKITVAAAKSAKINDKRSIKFLLKGSLWPDAPAKGLVPSLSVIVQLKLLKNKKNLIYRSHMGDLQYWHSMSPSAKKTNEQVRTLILKQIKGWYHEGLTAKKDYIKFKKKVAKLKKGTIKRGRAKKKMKKAQNEEGTKGGLLQCRKATTHPSRCVLICPYYPKQTRTCHLFSRLHQTRWHKALHQREYNRQSDVSWSQSDQKNQKVRKRFFSRFVQEVSPSNSGLDKGIWCQTCPDTLQSCHADV